MMDYLLVMIGGGIGAGLRHAANVHLPRLLGSGFPYATLAVNVIGSLLMGLFVGWLARQAGGAGAGLRLFLATGILGGFTTFSAFSLDTVLLWERGDTALALLYALASVLVSVLALAAGLALVRAAG
ncbi:fluoride efflux transporter CrcB [Pannonibacter tanglangensis]|uniref:Fluoride-specific ion channel FluC n=1 Tax=Pannonibacter tanglangensis TaxID=2750084 RepID=A0ABW9ZFT4_9HYPH|nr:fluoride efflux transporter CrcB [Pannonibacter sp. XCT-34]